MKVTSHSNVPVYTIAGTSNARPLPEWLARRSKRKLKNDPDYANRIDLLQDFEFEEASACVRASEDGQWIMSTGTYKPQIHTHYLPHLSLSFSRHTSSLNHSFQLLSSDYSKSLHLQTDRSLEFHTPSGCHYTARIPRYGRDLQFDRRSAEALVPAVGVNADGNGEVYRLNLEVGRFMKAYEVDVGGDDLESAGAGALQGGIGAGSVNAAAVAEQSHNLLAFGTSIGTVEFWDSRSRSRVGLLATPGGFDGTPEVTALDFHQSGLSLAAGSSNGLVHLYDLRSPIPLLKKDQGYGYPIQTLSFLTPSTSQRGQSMEPKIMAADKRIIKIWETREGAPWTSVEPAVDLNSVVWCQDSGMLLTANEGKQQHAFFIPQLGPAPKWCSFLDNLTEENEAFEEKSVYDNFTFVTKPQLKALSLDHLIGSSGLLRPYMHGYFVDQKLYEQARAISNPHEYEEARAKRVREKIEAERNSRIRGGVGKSTPKVKVNKALAEKISAQEEKRQAKRKERAPEKPDATEPQPVPGQPKADKENLLTDPRFSALFQNEDFAVDETSREYQLINPVPRQGEPGRNGVHAVGSDDGAESDSARSDQEEGVRVEAISIAPPREKEMHISTPSYKRSGHESLQSRRERESGKAFGRRIDEPRGDTKKKSRSVKAGNANGTGEISWAVPKKGKSNSGAPAAERGQGGGHRDKSRRSASGNQLLGR